MDADQENLSGESLDAPDSSSQFNDNESTAAHAGTDEPSSGIELSAESDRPVTGPIVSAPPTTEYRCPGETHSISRAIHLSRLAAFYPACRQCQHRHDTGQLNPETVERLHQSEARGRGRELFQRDGIRGVFLNDFTPSNAAGIASALASWLWQDVPLTGRSGSSCSDAVARRPDKPSRRGPSIVVGYDERPSSPAILSAVIDALRMMGCPVIDVGLASRPCFAFAVDHLQAAGGLFVSGAGCDAAWSGLDLYREAAAPLSLGNGLEEVRKRYHSGVTRPTRSAAFQRAFQAGVPYEAGLWKHFHALRPLRVVSAVRPRPARRTIRKLFSRLPCELFEVETTAAINEPLKHEVLLERISTRVRKRQAHLGILIDDDGARCWFIDDRGRLVDPLSLTAMLSIQSRLDHPNAPIVVESAATEKIQTMLPPVEILAGGDSVGAMSGRMRESNASFGGGQSHCYWFRESYPACDAILTLAHVLQGLSRADTAFSDTLPSRC